METFVCKCHNKEFISEKKLNQHLWLIKWLNIPGNREKQYKRNRLHREKNSERFNAYGRKVYKENLSTWEGYIPVETNCEICGVQLFFNRDIKRKTIHFDHRDPKVAITVEPSRFLAANKRTPENEKIWESCNFGILCNQCNRFLPTENREEFVKSVLRYILYRD